MATLPDSASRARCRVEGTIAGFSAGEDWCWTAEERKEDALMVLPYRLGRVDAAGKYFDATARRIQAGEFAVTVPPEPRICGECDLRTLCRAEGVIGEVG